MTDSKKILGTESEAVRPALDRRSFLKGGMAGAATISFCSARRSSRERRGAAVHG